MKYSFILPCRNEEKAIGICIKKIQTVMDRLCINKDDYEIISSDSSKDSSPMIARTLGARVVKHDKIGYGNAYLEGIKEAQGEILILGDADDTYDFSEIVKLLVHIEDYDIVLGERKYFHKDSMPFLNKYLGNPFLSSILRLFFGAKVKDAHTGFRVIRKKTFDKLKLRTMGMEFASEMIIKAIKNHLKIKEVPIHYYPRKGETKLRRFPDGWRHLRFMLLYSPQFLFFIPGLVLFLIGLISMALLYFDLFSVLGIRLYYHPMFLSEVFIIAGYQLIIFSVFAKTYAINHLGEESPLMNKIYKYITIEKASIFGLFILFAGIFIYIKIFAEWVSTGFGNLQEIKNSIVALTLILISIQTIFSAFMLSILGIQER
jgi:glycosyltransferase involved in cell wall biosynthesis